MKEQIEKLDGNIEGRAGADTIRLWEGYKEQAFLWRIIALLQLPTTFLSMSTAMIMWAYADTIIEVPPKPHPGYYSVRELPDSTFINVAGEVVNLIGTYQPDSVADQYNVARKYLWEPALSAMQKYMNDEIQAIKTTGRSQLFLIIHNLTKVERDDRRDTVTVKFEGMRHKIIGVSALPPDSYTYEIEMRTIPRNISNEYGVVVTAVKLKQTGSS